MHYIFFFLETWIVRAQSIKLCCEWLCILCLHLISACLNSRHSIVCTRCCFGPYQNRLVLFRFFCYFFDHVLYTFNKYFFFASVSFFFIRSIDCWLGVLFPFWIVRVRCWLMRLGSFVFVCLVCTRSLQHYELVTHLFSLFCFFTQKNERRIIVVGIAVFKWRVSFECYVRV